MNLCNLSAILLSQENDSLGIGLLLGGFYVKTQTSDDGGSSKDHAKLNAECSFRKIAKILVNPPRRFLKKSKRTVPSNAPAPMDECNPCRHRRNCQERLLCGKLYCKKMSCAYCKEGCSPRCPSFEREDCPKLEKPPYVCNGCKTRNKCTLVKFFYMPSVAHNRYRETLSVSRQGSLSRRRRLNSSTRDLSRAQARVVSTARGRWRKIPCRAPYEHSTVWSQLSSALTVSTSLQSALSTATQGQTTQD